MPCRIQMQRKKGWRKPQGARVVTRATRFGNPWPIGAEGPDGRLAPDATAAVGLFRDMLADPQRRQMVGYPSDDDIRAELRGRDLGCTCPLDQLCHADVLLELANRTEDT